MDTYKTKYRTPDGKIKSGKKTTEDSFVGYAEMLVRTGQAVRVEQIDEFGYSFSTYHRENDTSEPVGRKY